MNAPAATLAATALLAVLATSRDSVAAAEPPLPTCAPSLPATAEFRRLSHVEYANTVQALLSLEAPLELLAEPSSGEITEAEWSGYHTAARELATTLLADESLRTAVLPCFEDTSECVERIATEFGRLAWRRPLAEEELSTLSALSDVALVVETLLGTYDFVTRPEAIAPDPEGQGVLDDYAMASRLSYLLWQTMPDSELFAAAEAGTLNVPEAVLAQAERMIRDERALVMLGGFHEFYLDMGPGSFWDSATHDSVRFPLYDDTLVPDMLEETRLVMAEVAAADGSVSDLFSTTIGYVNDRTAPLYGLDASAFGSELARVELGPERPGVFTRLGFLSAYSHYDATAPLLRGAFLLRNIQCVDVGDPPPGAASTPVPDDPDLITQRERMTALTAPVACSACHTLIDPIGFALESFDAVGQLRTTDNGAPVDTNATVMVYPESVIVTGPAQLMRALATSPTPSHCYAQKWIQYAFAFEPGEHSCLADKLAIVLEQGSILEMLVATTQSEWFLGALSGSPEPEPDDGPVDVGPSGPEPEPEPEPESEPEAIDAGADGGEAPRTEDEGPSMPPIPDAGIGGIEADDSGAPMVRADAAPRPASDSNAVGVESKAEGPSCGCRALGARKAAGGDWGWLALVSIWRRRRRELQ